MEGGTCLHSSFFFSLLILGDFCASFYKILDFYIDLSAQKALDKNHQLKKKSSANSYKNSKYNGTEENFINIVQSIKKPYNQVSCEQAS